MSGNRQSRSIGEDGDTAGDGTPRAPLYMDRNSFIVRFVTNAVLLRQEGMEKPAYLPHFCFVVMGDGVMAAIEYVRSVPQKCRPTE